MIDGPITNEGVRVLAEQCATCIFRKGNLMGLRPGRVRSMIDQALADNSAIVCHELLDGERAVCRGFYDRHWRDTLMGRLSHESLLGTIEVTPP